MKRFSSVSTGILLAFLAVSGCGGGGQISLTGDALRQTVAQTVQKGFSNRNALNNQAMRTRLPLVRDGSNGDYPDSIQSYFDEYLGLWVFHEENGTLYFLDEDRTQEAGRSTIEYKVTDDGSEFRQETVITAGLRAGFRSTFLMVVSGEDVSISYEGVDPETGPFSYDISYSLNNESYVFSDGSEGSSGQAYEIEMHDDGSQTVTYQNDRRFTYKLRFAPDGSGIGQVTGNSPLLPAKVAWDDSGTGRIAFADGSMIEFENFAFDF